MIFIKIIVDYENGKTNVEAPCIKKSDCDLFTLQLESQSVSAASKTFTVLQQFVCDKTSHLPTLDRYSSYFNISLHFH